MRTRSILLAAGVLTMSLAPIGSGLVSASAQIYDFTTIAGAAGVYGSADGTNSAARFNYPIGVAVDTNGNLYVADYGNSTIRKIAPVGTDWVTSTIAGLLWYVGSTDGTNSTARFQYPRGVAVDANGNVYVADSSNDTIRKATPVGTNWVTSTIAGTVTNSGSADGINNAARFNNPYDVAVDTNGNLYVTDYYNSTIRKIVPVGTNWVTSTIAGTVTNAGSADGTNSTARFNNPAGIAVDSSNNLYVADMGNNTIRKVTPIGTNWVTTTIAGSALNPGSADGTNSDARFDWPRGVAVDTNGNLYVADTGNDTIRKITPAGANWVTTTIGGTVTNSGTADGTNSVARFYQPFGVAVDDSGNLYVTDTYNYTIRLGVPWGALTITKESAKVNFAKPNSDSCTLTAMLDLGASYDLTNKPVSLDIGGADAWFNLDAKGKGHGVGTNGTYGTCKLSYKKNTGPWTFTVSLKKGSWATQWQSYGLTNATIVTNVTLPVTLAISNDVFYGDNKTLHYKAKVDKSGSAK